MKKLFRRSNLILLIRACLKSIQVDFQLFVVLAKYKIWGISGY